jgi:hypothetical protein
MKPFDYRRERRTIEYDNALAKEQASRNEQTIDFMIHVMDILFNMAEINKMSLAELDELKRDVEAHYSSSIQPLEQDGIFIPKRDVLIIINSFRDMFLEKIQRQQVCSNFPSIEQLRYVKGPVGLSWINYKGRDIWIFGEKHIDLTEKCSKHSLDVTRKGDSLFFSGDNCAYFTFPRLLYAWFSRAKKGPQLKNTGQKNITFLYESVLLPLTEGENYTEKIAYMGKLKHIFSQCSGRQKELCAFLPEVFMHMTDVRHSNGFSNKLHTLKLHPNSVLRLAREHAKTIEYFDPLAFAFLTLQNEMMTPYNDGSERNMDLKRQKHAEILQHVYSTFDNGENGKDHFFDVGDLVYHILNDDHFDQYMKNFFPHGLYMAIELAKDNYAKYGWLSTYVELLTHKELLSAFGQNNLFRKGYKVMPDGRVVSRIRAQLLGLDKDRSYHEMGGKKELMSTLLSGWTMEKVKEVLKYVTPEKGTAKISLDNLLSPIEVLKTMNQLLLINVLLVDTLGIARALRTYGGLRKNDEIIGYYGDKHRKNWVNFFTTVLDAKVIDQLNDQDSCLILTDKLRDALLQRIN